MTDKDTLERLAIPPAMKSRGRGGPAGLVVTILVLLAAGAALFLVTRKQDRAGTYQGIGPGAATAATPTNAPPAEPKPGDPVLTVSGYVVPRERIEISPRFPGIVKWIEIKKGDLVKKDQILVRLENDEYRARVAEAEGGLAAAVAALGNAEVEWTRQQELARTDTESRRAYDQARWAFEAAKAQTAVASGQLALAQTYLEWCVIRAPIDGTVLEKLVSPNELVTPQSFGGTRGPSTAFLAMADLNDLQVEIDLNESDTPKVSLNQKCVVSPEAYPDRHYQAHVAEIAPEANRSKGTLQIKVQVEKPDRFLTPELTAKVDFLRDEKREP